MKPEIEDIYDLSPVQDGILFHVLSNPNSTIYLEQLSWTIKGDLKVPLFEQAWQQVLDRHGVLRTSFHWQDLDSPVQVVHKKIALTVWLEDWRHMPEMSQERRLNDHLRADRSAQFDFSRAPLMRLSLFRLADDVYQFVWTFHHIIMDGWSYTIVLQEAFAMYGALVTGDSLTLPLPPPYSQYIVWRQQQDHAGTERFWREMLSGFIAPTPLAIDHAPGEHPPVPEPSALQQLNLPASMTAVIHALARQLQITVNSLIQGAWACLLNRYSGESDVVFGGTTSGRPVELPRIQSMVGLFINTLPVRVRIDANEMVADFLKAIQQQQVLARQYEYVSLIDIQGWSEVPRSLPLFNSIWVFENVAADASLRASALGVEIHNFLYFGSTNYPITIVAVPGAEIAIKVMYDTARFDAEAIDRLRGHFERLLESITAGPERRLSELQMLSESERRQVLIEFNDTATDWETEICLQDMICSQADRSPDSIAVAYEQEVISYRELDERSWRVARYLRRQGLGVESLVGISMERSAEIVIGLLAIMKAGAAYVPLDPEYPEERLRYMMENAGVEVVVTEGDLKERLWALGARLVVMDEEWGEVRRESREPFNSGATPANLVYVIYTSGSTGRPKGIAYPHSGIVNLTQWHLATVPSRARTLQFASWGFDVSLHDLSSTLCSGGTLYVLPETLRHDIGAMADFLAASGIEKMVIPVGVLQHLAQEYSQRDLSVAFTELCAAGEQLQITGPVLNLFGRLRGCVLYNQYGPAETHVVTMSPLPDHPDLWPKYPPLGKPLGNARIFLLDGDLRPVPVGILGEIWIGGTPVGRGYVNRPDLTAERYLSDPFNAVPGVRLYRTGDLARFLPDGTIEYAGRIDHQVKIRGFRVEPGEVEAVLGEHPAVRATAVMLREDSPGDKRLVAYVAVDPQQSPTTTELRQFLNNRLPDYFVPSFFAIMDALPLTVNGKVNRRALPAPDHSRPDIESRYTPPRTELEEWLTTLWEEVLGVERIGINDNFLDLGGHSLLATQLVSRVRRRYEIELQPGSLFEAPTVAEWSALIEQLLTETILALDEEEALRLVHSEF